MTRLTDEQIEMLANPPWPGAVLNLVATDDVLFAFFQSMAQEVQRWRSLGEKVEHAGSSGGCPACGVLYPKSPPHAPDCELAALLGRTP